MHEWQSLSHVRWGLQVPRGDHTEVPPESLLRKAASADHQDSSDLCRQRGIELVEGHAMPDHVHLCLSIPPKYSVRIRSAS